MTEVAENKLVELDVHQELYVHLTEDEVNNTAKEAIKITFEIDKLEEEFSSVKSDWKARIDAKTGDLDNLRRKVKHRREYRKVDAKQVYDHANKTTYILYAGEKYDTRPMNDKEIQMLSMEPIVGTKEEAMESVKPAKKKKGDKPPAIEPEIEESADFLDVQSVMRDEKNKKTKKDVLAK